MARHAEQGITHVITFSSTHFRWSFRPYWDKITECLAKVVRAGHKYGIKVIEHHYANLTHYLDTKEQWDEFEGEMQLRNSSTKNWPGLEEWMMSPDNEIERWIQYSGLTGKPAVPYGGHGRCFNNEEYVSQYLDYLETIYKTGVDGIMTDDVHWFMPWSCACPVCRKLFKEQTGYDLPDTEHWGSWVGNYEDPSFTAWLHFRYASTRRFHQRVKDHYERLGLKMLRPNYTSVALCPSLTACILDDLPALDWVFQECCFSTIIRYTWPLYLLDQLQRRLMERERRIPSMMMFYANREDQLAFSWGIARLCGALYTNTPEGVSCMDETPYRDFEKKYSDAIFDCESLAEVGFIDSLENRRFAVAYEASRMKFWIQSAFFENLPVELANSKNPASWKQFSVLCVNEVYLLSDQEISDLKAYAQAGGTLVITGRSGERDEHGRRLSLTEMESRWGVQLGDDRNEIKVFPLGKGRIVRPGWDFGYPGTPEIREKIFQTRWNGPEHNNKLLDLRQDIPELWLPRAYKQQCNAEGRMPNNNGYYGGEKERKEVVALLRSLLPCVPSFRVENLSELVLAVPLQGRTSHLLSIQLLNASGTMKRGTDQWMSHDDPIPFPPHAGTAHFYLRIPAGMPMPAQAVFAVPGDTGETNLQVSMDGQVISICLPLSLLKTCGTIFLRGQ